MPKNKNGKKKRITKTKPVSVPLAQSSILKQRAPTITNRGPVYRIKHREVVAYNAGSFSPFATHINPCNLKLFPWLSGIAKMYERYRFVSLKFDYVPACPSTTLGMRATAIDYDPSDDTPGTIMLMLTYKTATSGPLWAKSTTILDVPSAFRDTPTKFTRTKDVDSFTPTELRTMDCGKLIICHDRATEGSGGWMFVDYVIDLYEPQVPTGGDATGVSIRAVQNATNDNITAANPYGSSTTKTEAGLSMDIDTTTNPPTFTLHDAPLGSYVQLMEEVQTRAAAVKNYIPTAVSGLTLIRDLWTAMAGGGTTPTNAVSTHPGIYRIDSSVAKFQSGLDLTGTSGATTPTLTRMFASVIPNNFV